MSTHDKITSLRAMREFGAIRGQLECDRDEWLALRGTDGEDHEGEAQDKADVFQGLIDLLGDYPCIAPPEVHASIECLTPRERDVALSLVRGNTMTATAKTLGMSKHTCRNHLKHAFRKLEVHSQLELVAKLKGIV